MTDKKTCIKKAERLLELASDDVHDESATRNALLEAIAWALLAQVVEKGEN